MKLQLLLKEAVELAAALNKTMKRMKPICRAVVRAPPYLNVPLIQLKTDLSIQYHSTLIKMKKRSRQLLKTLQRVH